MGNVLLCFKEISRDFFYQNSHADYSTTQSIWRVDVTSKHIVAEIDGNALTVRRKGQWEWKSQLASFSCSLSRMTNAREFSSGIFSNESMQAQPMPFFFAQCDVLADTWHVFLHCIHHPQRHWNNSTYPDFIRKWWHCAVSLMNRKKTYFHKKTRSLNVIRISVAFQYQTYKSNVLTAIWCEIWRYNRNNCSLSWVTTHSLF